MAKIIIIIDLLRKNIREKKRFTQVRRTFKFYKNKG